MERAILNETWTNAGASLFVAHREISMKFSQANERHIPDLATSFRCLPSTNKVILKMNTLEKLGA